MQVYPFLISHCKNNRPLFTDRFPLYTNTDREKERRSASWKEEGVAQLYIQKPKKQWQYLKSVRIEKGQRRKEREDDGRGGNVLGFLFHCESDINKFLNYTIEHTNK